jgi:hypothetical protein
MRRAAGPRGTSLGLLALLLACASAPSAPDAPPPAPPRAAAPPEVPPENAYAGAIAAAREAGGLRIRDGVDAADVQARLDRKARHVADALQLATRAVGEQPYAGRSFGHRLMARVLLDLADDLEALPGAEDRVRRYRDEAAVALRRCASFDRPPDVQAGCRAMLQELESPGPAEVITRRREGLARCVEREEGFRSWEGTLQLVVGEAGVEEVSFSPRPPGGLPDCLSAWARTLPLRGPMVLEVPLVLRAAE